MVSWILNSNGWIGFGANWDLEIGSQLWRDLMYKLVHTPNSKIMIKKGFDRHDYSLWALVTGYWATILT